MHSQSFVGRDPWTVLSGSPSGACGLGRAAVARKRRVLAMLATRGLEVAPALLCVALIPCPAKRLGTLLRPPAYARPHQTAPEGESAQGRQPPRAAKDPE
jgi:hypothetical protein